MRNAIVSFVMISILVSACTPKLVSRSDVAIQQLGVCVEYDNTVPEEIQIGFDRHLQSFANQYNSQSHSIYLHPCEDANQRSLRLYIANTKMISSGQQVAGAIVSAIGLAAPFAMVAAGAPFYIAFYYFPHNTSSVAVSLSNDLSEVENYFIDRQVASWAFLVRPEKQLLKHPRKFEQFLSILLRELELEQRKYRRNRRAIANH